jgi:hypothetical protein
VTAIHHNRPRSPEIEGGGLGERALDFEQRLAVSSDEALTAASRGSGGGASFMAGGSLV